MDLTLIYSTLLLLTSPLTGYILYKLTSNEKDLIEYYFSAILWTLAVTSAILYSINIKYAIITTYMFLTTLTWYKLNKKPLKYH